MKDRESGNFRAVVYVFMSSRARYDKKNLEKKRKAFREGRMTAHNVRLFPRTYGKELQVNPDFGRTDRMTLSPLGLRLAGFD